MANNTLILLSLPTLPHKPTTTHLHKRTDHSPKCPKLFKHLQQTSKHGLNNFSSLTLPTLLLPLLQNPDIAIAANGELGVLEGRTVALIHPIVMGGLYFFTLWAGYLGWQWRRVRTIQEEINELKKQLKASSSSSTDESSSDSPIEAQIEKLTEERKELLKGSFRDRHYNAGSILLGFGVIEAIGGGLDTWFRTGQLFPGPHLFGGAAITALWAAAAALAPAMQKGNETARNAHIALNVLNVLLFTSQIPTGFEILSSVFEYTTWP
ncbi:hypothetical protein Scep_025317 [Stephania cephalantha]|uniref:Uncharacterized protein n=1 Tax=Stephania cephalantha TaxID=152367 RepID=A0AAP0EQD0_9MAGN